MRKGVGHRFLQTLGIPFVTFSGDDFEAFLIYSHEQGLDLIRKGQRSGRFDAKEAERLTNILLKSGIASTNAQVFESVAKFRVGSNPPPRFEFRACSCGHPLKHGYIHDRKNPSDGKLGPVFDLLNGLNACDVGVSSRFITVEEAVLLFQAMQKIGLAESPATTLRDLQRVSDQDQLAVAMIELKRSHPELNF
jgi:hypothetical protein